LETFFLDSNSVSVRTFFGRPRGFLTDYSVNTLLSVEIPYFVTRLDLFYFNSGLICVMVADLLFLFYLIVTSGEMSLTRIS